MHTGYAKGMKQPLDAEPVDRTVRIRSDQGTGRALGGARLSQRARRIIRQNLVISLGTVVVLVTFALFGGIPLTVGVVGHEGSTVIVVLNSLRLLLNASSPAAAPLPPATLPVGGV